MTDSETTAPRSTFGWLPKLVLWGVVIAFGYLYLNSIDQQKGGEMSASLREKITQVLPESLSSLPSLWSKSEPVVIEQAAPSKPANTMPVAERQPPDQMQTRPVAANPFMAPAVSPPPTPFVYPSAPPVEPVKPAVERPHAPESPPVKDSQPVNEAESTVFADSLMNKKPAPPPPATWQGAAVAPPKMPDPAPVAPKTPSAPAAHHQSAPATAVPSGYAPSAHDWDAMARMQAEYEAKRREADERMRQYWERMRNAAPAAPYGYYPGYPAGYGPSTAAPPR